MPISVAQYTYEGSLNGPELIHVNSELELAHLRELQIELCELRIHTHTRQKLHYSVNSITFGERK